MRDAGPAQAMPASQLGLVNRSVIQDFLKLLGDMKGVGTRRAFLFDLRRRLCFQGLRFVLKGI